MWLCRGLFIKKSGGWLYGARSLLQRYIGRTRTLSDVVNGGKRKRKEASGQVGQGLIDFLIGSCIVHDLW